MAAHLTRSMSMSAFYDIKEKDADGNEVSFSKFKVGGCISPYAGQNRRGQLSQGGVYENQGKVVYGVNVASRCGYTASNYKLMQKLSQIPGLEIALFPCNVRQRPHTLVVR
jgi:glutathione peroxidase-family protein